MTSLRILLIENDSRRADDVLSSLESASHSGVPVPTLVDASEALSLEKFDAVLLGSMPSSEELARFTAALRGVEASQHLRIPLLCCAETNGGSGAVDGYLPDRFSFRSLSEIVSSCQEAQPEKALAASSDTGLPVFEEAQFVEQCAGDDGLMLEILDLFAAECQQELPEMAEGLVAGDFDAIARIAHTLKGSLGSLHAPAARCQTQTLETAAKQHDTSGCGQALQALEELLSTLEIRLASFRQSLSSP